MSPDGPLETAPFCDSYYGEGESSYTVIPEGEKFCYDVDASYRTESGYWELVLLVDGDIRGSVK